MARLLIAGWALTGMSLVLLRPVARMLPLIQDTLQHAMSGLLIAALAASLLFIGLTEAYMAFHRRFAPRFAERLQRLVRERPLLGGLLAPLACMGLVPLDRDDVRVWGRTLVVVAGVVLLIVVVRQFPQPWRGAVLFGVAPALVLGWASTVWHSLRALRRDDDQRA